MQLQAILVWWALPCLLSAQVAITGKIVDETGAAVEGARVELRTAAGPAVSGSSDRAGNFKLLLPSDGEYNIQYCAPGIPDRNSNGRNNEKGSCTAANGSSTQQARTLCQNMRTAGLTVYAVGFQLGNSPDALTTLRDHCASDSTTFYNANDGEQLRQAFRDIALKISTLHLSK